jgi:hypothetical protein
MWTTFLWTFVNNMTWFSIIQTKIVCMLTLFLLLHEGLQSCFINMHGDAKGWVGITSRKLLCVVNVGSWCLSCQHSKNMLSHQTTCVMAWLNVEGLGMVRRIFFTSPSNPNWIWLMSVISTHEILQANYLKSNAYNTTWTWSLAKKLYFDDRHVFFFQIFKGDIELLKNCFKVIE